MMGCLQSSPISEDQDVLKQQQEANKKINDQIKRDRRRFKATHRLLLLGKSQYGPRMCSTAAVLMHVTCSTGAGESGKSTIVKQMKLLHVDGFSEE